MMVAETEAMIILPISFLLSPSCSRTSGINGATPNQPKKQKKNVIQVIWNVRIWMPLKEKILRWSSGLGCSFMMLRFFFVVFYNLSVAHGVLSCCLLFYLVIFNNVS